ncbi:hypothetical protein FYZ37_02640 [Mobiluncus curtisii]|nr:hypothetical protein [Mobiluncus curtisii]NMX13022.1 hypothetical protein [Mobiluncus curtisii]
MPTGQGFEPDGGHPPVHLTLKIPAAAATYPAASESKLGPFTLTSVPVLVLMRYLCCASAGRK